MNHNKMKNYKIIASLVCLAAVFGVSNAAHSKAAKCEIAMIGWMGPDKYVGPCDFIPGKNGSFTLRGPKGDFLIEFVERIRLEILRPGVARAQTYGFPNSADFSMEHRGNSGPWIVRRDTKKPACWVGEDVRICAY
jgi:hypothetical protein